MLGQGGVAGFESGKRDRDKLKHIPAWIEDEQEILHKFNIDTSTHTYTETLLQSYVFETFYFIKC